MMNDKDFRRLELQGGIVTGGLDYTFWLPPVTSGYTDAQIDDYGIVEADGRQNRRAIFRWRPGVRLQLQARFSHGREHLLGTAGFGFWNAPFGDPSVRRPALPQAAWFFFASPPSDLPLAQTGQGCGWFASTLDAGQKTAVSLIPISPIVLLLNQLPTLKNRIWPVVRRRLGISFTPIPVEMTAWHSYELLWLASGCTFKLDGRIVLQTGHSPRGPLGFVCWLDNQFMVLTNNGRFRWGVLPLPTAQWMEIRNLTFGPAETL